LWLIGRKRDARAMFERLLALRNDVGLLAEEYDSDAQRMAGNFPQALSHISLVHAAFVMSGTWKPLHSEMPAGKATRETEANSASDTTKGRRERS
jgi:hypothetical protein